MHFNTQQIHKTIRKEVYAGNASNDSTLVLTVKSEPHPILLFHFTFYYRYHTQRYRRRISFVILSTSQQVNKTSLQQIPHVNLADIDFDLNPRAKFIVLERHKAIS